MISSASAITSFSRSWTAGTWAKKCTGKPPWAIYRKKDSWIYVWIGSAEPAVPHGA